jgi:uncharacterized protein YciW
VINDTLGDFFEGSYLQGCAYAKALTLQPATIKKEAVDLLRTTGFSDGEILEINQVASYFNYVNRTVLGLGVDTQGDIIGLSPTNSDDPENWNHQ